MVHLHHTTRGDPTPAHAGAYIFRANRTGSFTREASVASLTTLVSPAGTLFPSHEAGSGFRPGVLSVFTFQIYIRFGVLPSEAHDAGWIDSAPGEA